MAARKWHRAQRLRNACASNTREIKASDAWHDACEATRPGEGVEYFELIRMLSKSAAIATPEQAECTLFTTLETLGALLPEWLLDDLAAQLPAECEPALRLGASISLGVRRAPRSELMGRELERVQATYALLATRFTALVVRDLEHELPAFLRRAARTCLPPTPDAARREISRVALLPRGGLRRSGRS